MNILLIIPCLLTTRYPRSNYHKLVQPGPLPGNFLNFPGSILNNFKTLTIHLLIRNLLRIFVCEK